MGLLGPVLGFCTGAVVGVYLAQNYALPPLQTVVDAGIVFARRLEENYRKGTPPPPPPPTRPQQSDAGWPPRPSSRE
eukprot:SM000221S06944  [mRNA]  locus=s221:174845:175075:- [translate_table: standard]